MTAKYFVAKKQEVISKRGSDAQDYLVEAGVPVAVGLK